MPPRGASPDTLDNKYTPSFIHNKVTINNCELISYFKSHTLSECAEKYRCAPVTIKRKLRAIGIDTSIHNHSEIAKNKSSQVNSKFKLSKDELYHLYIEANLDTKSIASQFGLHYNTIRKWAKKHDLNKLPKDVSKSMMARHARIHGYSHPSQRPDVMEKTRRSAQMVIYNHNGVMTKMRSLHELGYALYLDSLELEWHYEEMRIPYVDNMSGKWRIYVVDFTVIDGDNVRWIEVKPNDKMIPSDKRIYASRRAEESGTEYRGITQSERDASYKLLLGGYNADKIEYLRPSPRCTAKQISYFFKNNNELNKYKIPPGWKKHSVVEHSKCLISLKMRRVK